MPGAPEFIPLPKAKEMFALSSWRDSPGIHGGTSAVGTQPSPIPSSADAPAPGGHKASLTGGGGTHSGPSATAGSLPMMPSSLPPPGGATAGTAAAAVGGGRTTRRMRGAKGHHQRQKQQQQQQQQWDVDDFFLHVFLPMDVAYEAVLREVQVHASPLRVMDVGPPILLFPNNRPKEKKEPAPVGGGASRSTAASTQKEECVGKPASGVHLTPFATPAVHAVHTATAAVPPLEEDDEGKESRFLLPPPEQAMDGSSSASTNSKAGTRVTSPTANVVVDAATTTTSAAEAATAAAAVSGDVEELYQVSFLFAEGEEANTMASFVTKRWPTAVVHVVPRNRSLLNASLVLKGLPSMNKTEYILEELEKLPYGASYVRLHRGERGVYKNVVFAKYADREAAEDSKVRLERVFVGSRPLKVEFKKKSSLQRSDATAAGCNNGNGNGNGAVAVAVAVAGSLGTLPGGATNAEEDEGVAVAGAAQALQQMVRDLRVSTEHEGFSYKREQLSKEEIKLLKQLCQAYGLLFDMSESKVTVRRSLGGGATTSAAQGAAAHSAAPSPALRSHMPSPTPMWAPTTPAPLRPMDFKGISHWKDIRREQSTIGICRPVGPEDGVPPFSAGRGRPV